jgi:hypothetical protein
MIMVLMMRLKPAGLFPIPAVAAQMKAAKVQRRKPAKKAVEQ